MSVFGSHKAQITKAAKALRNKITEVDLATLEPLDFTTEAGRDPQFILSRKSSLFLFLTSFDRAIAHLRAQREKAEEYARQHPDEQGECPLLQQIQAHWEASEMDQLVEEAEALHDRIDVAIKLLPSSEALYFARASTVPPFSITSSPHYTQDPNPTHQPAQGIGMEIRSHPSPQEQQHVEDLSVVAPADYTTPPTRVFSAAPGFSSPSQPPSHPPLLANPSAPSYDQLNPFLPSSSQTNPVPPSVEQSLKLPAFEIPTFHGDVDRFFEFWDLFSMAVHNNPNVPVPLKFMYLKSHLRGSAANIIAGFQSTAENYEDAVRTLTNTYGRPEILRNRLWDKLMQLTPASDSSLSQRATLCGIKAICAQLKHLKEDSSAIGTLKIIRAKFPRRTREKIGEFKRKGDTMWSVDELLETLDSIIDRLENVEDADPSDYHSYNSQSAVRQYSPSPRRYPSANRTDPAFTRYRSSSYYPRRPSTSHSPSPCSRRDRPPTPYYPRRASRSPSTSRARPEIRCAFCNNYHFSEHCRIVSDIAQRRTIVIRNNLCWLCLQSGHTYTRCDRPPCSCGRVHHRALCPDYLRLPRSPTPPARQTYSRSRYSSSPRRVQFDRDDYPSSSRAGVSPARRYHSKSVSPSRRQSTTSPSRRATSARRSRSPTLAVHSATCTSQSPDTTTTEPQFDYHQASVGAHSPSSCTSVCYEKSLQQEPRLMVVHAITKNYNSDVDELLTVFLDSGSQYSFIRTSLARHLGLSFRNTRTITTLTFGGHQFTEESSEVTLVLWDQHNYPVELDLWTRETITTVPRANTQNDKDIVDLEDRVEVDVLIGIDNYWHIVDLHKNERLPSGLILSQTRFGPVLSGLKCPAVSNTLAVISTLFADDEPRSEQLVRSLLGLDSLGLDEKEDAEDAKVIQQFYDTVKIINGNIYVSFPWKEAHPPLADNKALAFRRLQSQYGRLSSTPSVWKEYCRLIDEQLKKGVIEDVTRVIAQSSNVYYIPHQAVFKEGSSTTKLRIVFDASSHQKDCPSLNDCIHQGPSLLPDLVGILMRSRLHCYLVIADVEKAFHQIHLHQDQRDSTRFLWLKDTQQPPSTENLRVLRFARVPFGINASPFLLSMSIRYFLEQDPANRLKEEILTNTYVDNIIVGAVTTQECIDKTKECKDIFARMSMNLRQFMSNSTSTMLSIPQTDCITLQGQFVNLLGIKWNPTLDLLHVPINIAHQRVTTKRTALQAYASTFDPLGLLTPLLVRPKMFIQDLWESGYGWDDNITDEDVHRWNTIVQDICGFHAQVPRFICYSQHDMYDLVVCSDASKRVYAVAIYILANLGNSSTKSTLFFAKAKLAPPGAITIPRMELLACHMAAKMARFVVSQLKVRLRSVKFLIDSQIVLYWMQSRKPLKTYVQNRVRYIRRVLDEFEKEQINTGFYYLSSELNPADCATRGLTASQLQHHMWWIGPGFFRTPFRQWPCTKFQPSRGSPAGAETEELRIPRITATSAVKIKGGYKSFIPFTRTNSYAKLVRITAYVLKYLAKLRVRVQARQDIRRSIKSTLLGTVDTTPTITADDFTTAELVLIREHYRESELQMHGSYVNKLNKRYDVDGTIRVNLRMGNARTGNPGDPILILSGHPLCDMLIAHYHQQLFHAGPSHLMTALRERFFIPKLKRSVKSFISRCVTCKRYQGRLCAYPQPPDLPVQRVTRSRPFQHVGLNYFGPIFARLLTCERHKVWICLFTCMATRALHLEVVRDNSTLQFLLAFRRFMARRGTPDSVTSDNAPTFKLGQEIINNELSKIADDSQTSQFLMRHNIRWKFITPYSPWKGGFYERLVGSVKTAFKKAVRNQVLDLWLLETLIVEIEAILNTRPLFPVNSTNPVTHMAIRPIDLITPNFRKARLTYNMPQRIASSSSDNYHALQTRYKELQSDLDSFWDIWQQEYLAVLAEREAKRVKDRPSTSFPKVGDVVLIQQDAPRSNWPLGLILELYTSSDGNTRSAKIKTGKRRVADRSINHLLPLEVVAENEEIPQRGYQRHLALKDNLQGTSKT